MNLAKIKSLFLKSLIGCLVAAALLAVVTVLIGKFNSVLARSLITILLIAVHCLLSFGFIVNNEKQETFENLTFFSNVTFVLIILSFITSVFGVWGVIPGELVAKLYAVYFVLLFATLHAEVLAKAVNRQKDLANIVYANYLFMVAVVLMLMTVIFVNSSSLSSIFYRLLAACGIVDATLTLITVILHKLYLQKHPKINDNVFGMGQVLGQAGVQYNQAALPQPKSHMNIFLKILIAYVILQVIGALFLVIAGTFAFSH